MKENSSQKESANLYSLLFTSDKSSNRLEAMLLDNDKSDEDFLNNSIQEEDNILILDKKLKEERDRRLNEKDKIYKIKKHYFLKDSYKKIVKEEMIELEVERLKEEDYLKQCNKAEDKLYENVELNANDVYYLLKRNYQLFTKDEKNDIELLKRTYKAYDYISIVSSLLLVSYCRAIMLYFKYEIRRSKFLSYFFLSLYGVGLFHSMKHFVNMSYSKNLGKFCYKARDRILNYENEYMKTPFNEDEKKFNPEEKNLMDIFKF
jgi:hypothetical protein